MGIWRSLAGTVDIHITSADIPGALRLMTDHSILLKDVEFVSDLSVSATLYRRDYKKVKTILTARGDKCDTSSKWGIIWSVRRMRKRPVLMIGIILLIVLTVYIPSRVFFIQVKGNQAVSSDRIIQFVQQEGLSFGCNRAKIRNEELKNSLLEKIPELDWVGITSSGCVATVEVRENQSLDKKEENGTISSLIASCDGVVESITVTNGTPLCKPGQAVRRGQVLISAYQDHGLLIKASDAEGEIFARTYRSFQVVTPTVSEYRGRYNAVSTKFSLQIGKNQINFSKYSGISPAGCVKMYEKRYLTLPGGFRLPIAFITEKSYSYECRSIQETPASVSWTEDFADQYIRDQMIAGEVISRKMTAETLEDVFVLTAEYACREQIGQKRIEESLNHNGKNS